jgi:hypothetical protein
LVTENLKEDRPMSRFSEAVRQRLTQVLSLSERAVRALSAVAVGASTLLTETLLPEALRGTTTYQVTIGLMQQYILEKVAGMETEIAAGQGGVSNNFAQRKMVGTALEAAGLLTVRFSPLWVFAIAGDVAGGSKVYLNRLVEHLKEKKIIAQETEVKELAGLLEAIQHAARQTATAVDTPPLSRKELSAMADEMRAGYGQAFERTADLIPQLDDIWESMQQLARRENISLERLGGLMMVDAVSGVKKGAGIVLAAGQTGARLFDEAILDSYRKTLAAASEQGVDGYMRDHMRPFLRAARSHFDSERTTWIERKLGEASTNSD